MTARRGHARRFHSTWAAADDNDFLRRRDRRQIADDVLSSRDTIIDAADRMMALSLTDAHLHAADTRPDVVKSALPDLAHEVRVRDLGTCHSDDVDVAAGEDRLGLERVDDPADADYGHG